MKQVKTRQEENNMNEVLPSGLSHSERFVEHESFFEEGVSEAPSGLLNHLKTQEREERDGGERG
jgi:hypothetical protein